MTVCFPYGGGTVSGSHLSSMLLARGLVRRGVDVKIAVHKEGILTEEIERQGFTWIMAPDLGGYSRGEPARRVAKAASIIPGVAKLIRSLGIDIVHTHDARMHRIWGLAARLAGRRFVWHQRSAGVSYKMAAFAELATEVITVSEYTRSCMPARLASRARVIDNPFDTDSAPPDRLIARDKLKIELGIDYGSAIVAFVSNSQQQRKRPEVFLKTGAIVSHDLDFPSHFPMFGIMRSKINTRVQDLIKELNLEDRVHLMGPRFPIEPWLSGCDVLVAPAVREPLGRTLIEAMIVGTPVVATNDGGNTEIIEHERTGLLFQPDDAKHCADRVIQLLKNKQYAETIAEAAQSEAKERFSIDKHAESVHNLYQGMLR